ncbi:MAG TPA: uracil phosphoribosyltransferase, partial [Algoriphagus sp.]|nr:uracil phosphoribosyltransferase [Algoriphagus sp.]
KRLGSILAYEISKSFPYEEKEISSPLASSNTLLPSSQPVLIAVLRASLPFYNGFLSVFDQSESGFIGAFRKENTSDEI